MRNEILDDDFNRRASKLTNFQLIGILTEKVKYPKEILDLISLEIENRNISLLEQEQLRTQYLTTITTNNLKLSDYVIPIIFLIFLLIFSNSVRAVFEFFIIGFSLFYVKRKYRKNTF